MKKQNDNVNIKTIKFGENLQLQNALSVKDFDKLVCIIGNQILETNKTFLSPSFVPMILPNKIFRLVELKNQ